MRRLLLFLATLFFCLNCLVGGNLISAQSVVAQTRPQKLSRSEEEAKRAIEARMASSIEAMRRKDTAARLEGFAPDWTGKLKDGEVVTLKDMEASFDRQHKSILSVSDETRMSVDSIELKGNEATVHTSQRFVRTIRGNDGQSVEVRTSVTHREVWIKTDKGWLAKHIEELEQGPTFVNGQEVFQDRAGWKFVKVVWDEGVNRAWAVFKDARQRDPKVVLFQEATLNNLGYKLIQKGRLADAIEVFRINTEAYPQSFNTYDSLAEAYMLKRERALAIENYQKSLELNPKNTNAVPMLERLGAPLSAETIWKMIDPPPNVELKADVQYCTGGGRALKMHILRPKTLPVAPLPVILFIHGGGWFEGHRNRGLAPLAYFAERGYLGVTVEYRLSNESKFPAQIEDIKCAVRFLRAKAKEFHLNPERIAAWGQSAGGHLAALLGTSGDVKELEGTGGWDKFSSRVAAVINWNGPTDFLEPGEMQLRARSKDDAPERLIGGRLTDNRQKAVRANPVTYITEDDPPFLIMHGDQDQVVSLNQSRLLYDALKKAGVEATLSVIEGAGHFGVDGVSPLPNNLAEMMSTFLASHLKSDKSSQ